MAYLHPESSECTLSELDLFKIPPTQVSIEKASYVEYHPIASIRQGAGIEFAISGSGDYYLDLATTLVHARIRVVKAQGAVLEDEDLVHVELKKLCLQTLFSQVDVFLNGRLVSSATDTYAYKAYLETILNYGKEAKETQLSASLMNHNQAPPLSKPVDMIGRLHADIFLQKKLLLSNVDLKLRFIPNNEKFALLLAQNAPAAFLPKIEILDFSLYIKRVKLSPQVMAAHIRVLETGVTAKYPFKRSDLRVHAIPTGSKSAHIDSLFLSQVPSRVVIGLVKHNAYAGDYKLNPYNFGHFDVSYLSLTADGEDCYGKALTPNYDDDNFIRSYFTLFTGLGTEFHDKGIGISREDYKTGYALYIFDLTQDQAADRPCHINLLRNGVVRLEIKFAKQLPQAVNVIAYAEFEALLEIDKSRNVIVDF